MRGDDLSQGAMEQTMTPLEMALTRSNKPKPPANCTRCEKFRVVGTGWYCGAKLGTTYLEERLYAVRCQDCHTITLIEARSPVMAEHAVGSMTDEYKERIGGYQPIGSGNIPVPPTSGSNAVQPEIRSAAIRDTR